MKEPPQGPSWKCLLWTLLYRHFCNMNGIADLDTNSDLGCSAGCYYRGLNKFWQFLIIVIVEWAPNNYSGY